MKVKAGKIVSYSQVDSEFNMNFFDGYGINILPKSSITLKAGLSLNGYKSSAITYRWSSKALNIKMKLDRKKQLMVHSIQFLQAKQVNQCLMVD